MLGCDVPAGTIQVRWFYLYLILDLYSRKIVGFEVHETDSPIMPCISSVAQRSPRACMRCRTPGPAWRQRLDSESHDSVGHVALARHQAVVLASAGER